MSNVMRSGHGRVLELETQVSNQRRELKRLNLQSRELKEYNDIVMKWVAAYRDMLPGGQKPKDVEAILKAFGEKAVLDIGTLMAACIDYRNVLITLHAGDPVSPRHEGVEDIMRRYGVKIEKQRKAGLEYLNATLTTVTNY